MGVPSLQLVKVDMTRCIRWYDIDTTNESRFLAGCIYSFVRFRLHYWLAGITSITELGDEYQATTLSRSNKKLTLYIIIIWVLSRPAYSFVTCGRYDWDKLTHKLRPISILSWKHVCVQFERSEAKLSISCMDSRYKSWRYCV